MAKRSARKHRVRRVLRAVTSTAWAVAPDKLTEIVAFLNMRAAGHELTRAEIAATFGEGHEDDRPRPQVVGGVAILPLYGLLAPRMNMMLQASGGTSTQEFANWYRAALANPAVRAIAIDCDSPGGTVPGTQELSDVIYAARGQKPSVTIVNLQCASGAVWVGTGTDRVVVSPSGMAGSVGVIHLHAEQSKADEAAGITRTLVRVPQFKGEFNGFEPLSADARAHMEEEAAANYANFVAALARNRGASPQTVEANFGQGRMLSAADAVTAGLADAVATFDDVLDELARSPSSGSSTIGSRSSAGRAAAAGTPGWQSVLGTSVTPHAKESHAMWEQLREKLVARGLCRADASEADVRKVAGAFLAAHGQPAGTDEAAVAFLGTLPIPQAAAAATGGAAAAQPTTQNAAAQQAQAASVTAGDGGTNAAPQQAASGNQAAAAQNGNGAAQVGNLHPVVPTPQPAAPVGGAQEQQTLVLNERQRIRDIGARGQLLGVDAGAIQTAIDSGVSLETACEQFTANLVPGNRPVQSAGGGDGSASVQGAPVDRIVAGASDALFARICAQDNRHEGREVPQLSAEARQFERMGFLQVAQAVVGAHGYRPASMDPTDVAIAFLQTAGTSLVPLAASDVPGNTAGTYPNLMSVLANKVMDAAVEFSTATYRQWTHQMDPVADFKPSTFVSLGSMGELPHHKDGDDFDEGQFAEEASWISVDSFGRDLKVTPLMVVNNNLTSFGEMFEDTQIDHDLTLNRLGVDLLTGNPTLPDGVAFFHANHGNLVVSGGPPSSGQAGGMRKLMRKQQGVGQKRKLRVGMKLSLVPSDLETENEQAFSQVTMIPVTDATTNVFKGAITPIVEPMLDDASALEWYGIADPRRVRTIVVAHMQGFQNGGKRMTYFWPKNQSQIFQIEGRFGAAVRNWRGIVKNPGA